MARIASYSRPMRADPESLLHDVFGFEHFRGVQEQVIDRVMAGRGTLAIMPTGAGKSLCYQLPAVALPGCCIVISPLIALMHDQLRSANALGIRAASLTSADADWRETQDRLVAGELDLLYVAPERASGEGFRALLERARICLFAIDEAHCVSEWGHDFRPDYRLLRPLLDTFPNVPRLALTATADRHTRSDILAQLGLPEDGLIVSGFDRPNIRYAVQPRDGIGRQLGDILAANPGPGIVYAPTRAATEQLAQTLSSGGRPVLPYHAGLAPEVRARNQAAFLASEDMVMVATVAFGMGIDKPDVRFVAHLDLPASIEAYYQETGRAGRDGLAADTLMLYGSEDIALRGRFIEESDAPDQRKRVERGKLDALLGLAETAGCRRQVLLSYFGDRCEPCGNCDTCAEPPRLFDGTIAAQKALSCIYRTGERFGQAYVVDVLLGVENERIVRSGHDRISTFGIGTEHDNRTWRAILRQLIALRLVGGDPPGHGGLSIATARRGLPRDQPVPMLRAPAAARARRRTGARAAAQSAVAEADRGLFQALRQKRLEIARAQNLPPYVIFHDKTLIELAAAKPSSRAEMADVPGVGEAKLDRYGPAFLAVIAEHA